MATVDQVQKQIQDAKSRLDGLRRLPVKSDIDHQLMDDLREYIADLFENLGELKREQAGRERGW